MATTTSSIYASYTQQVAIYVGFPVLIAGIIGETLNIIVFMSLHTFRQNSCAFYLLIMSCVNIGQLLTGLFPLIVMTGFGIDWTTDSLFYCKFRQYCRQVCALISLSCFCFATTDQFLATCFRPYFQKWSNIKIARRLCIITSVIWILHGIPCLIYFSLIPSSATARPSCTITNQVFSKYYTYCYTAVFTGYLPVSVVALFGTLAYYNVQRIEYRTRPLVRPVFTGYLPVSVVALFGTLAYYNVQRIEYRTRPLVRRELDKQLTVMVLILDIYNIIALLPYPVILVLISVTTITKNPIIAQQISFVSSLTSYTYFSYFACPFYIYICTSERFRRQLFHVLFKIHLERWRRRKVVAPLT
ncbi:unnamed protein product [Adineta steineri]|uniref:G-protein coupled receptors family 1 profile domain-containing protein n=1 Tax=Adineta steineri TaxID=433720 RepID=A0A814VWA9_9BILA|nr:unnamed protein product [Adineta steineri]